MNPFETQGYKFGKDIRLTGITSLYPIGMPHFSVKKLFSPADIIDAPWTRFIANRTLGDIQLLCRLEKIARDFDIFHSADPHYYYSYQLAKLRQEGKIKKLLLTSWETIPHNNEGTRAKRALKYAALDAADHILTYTMGAKQALLAEGVPPSKITTIPLGIDVEVFKPLKKNKSSIKTILFVGRLVEEKGVLDLYAVFKMLLESGVSGIRLQIVGQGPLRPVLRQSIRQDKLTDYVTLEERTYAEMPNVYAGAYLGVFPSKKARRWEEQYGMVFLEAMASGLPIVTARSGAIPEVVGNAALLTTEGNRKGLYTYVRRLLTDKNLHHKIGTMGRKRAVEVFDSRTFARHMGRLYKSL